MNPRRLVPMFLALLLTGHFTAVSKSEEVASASPAVMVQLSSPARLLLTLKTVAKNYLPEPVLKEVETAVLSTLDLNKLKEMGIEPNKPIGLYATMRPGSRKGEVSQGAVVGLVPISDAKAFVAFLGKLGLRLEKKGDEYSFSVPNIPTPAVLRFWKSHAYLCLAPSKIAAADLLPPAVLMSDKESVVAKLAIHLDRISDDLKKAYLAAFTQEMQKKMEVYEKLRGSTEGPPTPEQVRAETTLRTMRWGLRWVTLLINEGKSVTFRLDLDAKTGVLRNELSLEGRTGSDLATSIRDLPPTRNALAAIKGPDSAASFLLQTPLFIGDLKESLAWGVQLISQAPTNASKEDVPQETREAVSEAGKVLAQTLREGALDFAAALRGPDKNNKFTAVGAVSLKDTAAFEKALKTLAKSAAKDEANLIKLDAFQVKGFNVHEIGVGGLLPADEQNVFGKSSVFVSLSSNALFVTFGPAGKEVLTEVLTQKLFPTPAPLVQADISGKRIRDLFKTLGAPREPLQFLDKLTPAERSTVLEIKVEGGEKLVLRVDLGLPALWILSPKPAR